MAKTPIPKRLKEARNAAGLSQKALGIAAGIDEFSASARMNQYETGKHIPDYSVLKQISKVLKISPAYFYAENEEIAEIIRLLNNMSQKQRKNVINKINSMNKHTNFKNYK